ncbi:membrane progestin receptor alpha-B [Petromyzon marinus]|uniref:Membrane progestin receptor alpha-B-like n=2 Tax=Petromyzon marinus TaxID=7757 RepID=A0A1I9VZD9_PETMA|nr:membrane progestin receptor alpha-B-like [Petromyzon marinus]XP_032826171.1 membrane progestin receptor alpha-B-like [Petromyzon marinus]XP_032826172.1 membrane progestin receptor alpha-B-like [Petromyzon marinus]XP_032826173.1 membrane progestin receptor alpha-B-like [Petromyzon marinus]XP_032826174.1 membrane progestin receptor alpha-B-like [Petromyzon marinus]XP_032826175.1 membrane progestin receptor alpha-B-like [Petromyzon marinus]XP_032826177.1 membrane progestin receptor alpha-B-li
MATVIGEQIGRAYINLARLPSVLAALANRPLSSSPSSPTISSVCRTFREVPIVFHEKYITSGYRPPGQPWRFYALSLFARHNEIANVWTHLLGTLLVLARVGKIPELAATRADIASWPFFLLALSGAAYMALSTVAHLFHSRSELAHYGFFFLDYVGVALYQYGSAVGHYFYCAGPGGFAFLRDDVYLPTTWMLAWLSCAGCCFANLCFRMPHSLGRKLFKVLPCAVAYVVVISPIAHRLVTSSPNHDPAFVFHVAQVAFFLLSAVFFTFPLPEQLKPGRFNVLGHSHQIFHVLLSLCTITQIEAVHLDFLKRHNGRNHSDVEVRWALMSFGALAGLSIATAALCTLQMRKQLANKDK